MDEIKQIICAKCKSNQFTIIKSRNTNSYRNRGYRTFICLNCISIETEWETIQEVKTIHIPEYIDKIEELENIIIRLRRNNERMNKWIEDQLLSKSN